jgi:hypothetical protein
MAVKPPPKIGNNNKRSEIDRFINKGGQVENQKETMIMTTIRIPSGFFQRLDDYCDKTYQSRQHFMLQAIIKELAFKEKENNEN